MQETNVVEREIKEETSGREKKKKEDRERRSDRLPDLQLVEEGGRWRDLVFGENVSTKESSKRQECCREVSENESLTPPGCAGRPSTALIE